MSAHIRILFFLKKIMKPTEIQIIAVASANLKVEVDKDLEKEDPKNAADIIRTCGQNCDDFGEGVDV
jgi:hypothetical protein